MTAEERLINLERRVAELEEEVARLRALPPPACPHGVKFGPLDVTCHDPLKNVPVLTEEDMRQFDREAKEWSEAFQRHTRDMERLTADDLRVVVR